jgi:hypothetical protein
LSFKLKAQTDISHTIKKEGKGTGTKELTGQRPITKIWERMLILEITAISHSVRRSRSRGRGGGRGGSSNSISCSWQ